MTDQRVVTAPDTDGGDTGCRICGSPASFFATGLLMGKYDVKYYRCGGCGFVQTEEPYWLAESYSDAITGSDVGLVSRNITVARLVRTLVHVFFDAGGKFLDYGGGYGLMVRMMRDYGLDFYLSDKHCENIFAACFDADIPGGQRFELVTAVDVLEHLSDPVAEIARMLEVTDNIFLTTELMPPEVPKPGEWWYYGMDHGQHISFFTGRALSVIAEKYGLNLYSRNSFHLLTRKKLSPVMFRIVCSGKIGRLIGMFYRRKSLLHEDWHKTLAGSKKDA